MAVVYHEIYLPIDTESTFDYIVIKQGDAGTHRVRATLISNNRVYTIPTSGVSYYMKFRKPDNNYVLVQATVADNTISAEVTEEMLRVSGTGRGEFMIVSGSDELKTATFHVKIVKETFTSGDVQSHSDFAPFAALLSGAGAAASNANTAAAAANAAASLAEQKAQAIPDDYSELVAEVAGKADKSTTYTKDQVDQMIEDVEVETDTTLEVAGAPADAAETGRQIGLLNESLDALIAPPRLNDNTDLDSVIASGVYMLYANSAYLNKPTQDAEHGILEVWREKYGDNAGGFFQRLTYTYKKGRTNSEIWVRSKSAAANASWTPWICISNISDGMYRRLVTALINIFKDIPYIKGDSEKYINEIASTLEGEKKTLISVSATYDANDHTVYPWNALDSLRGYIIVTAYYDDGSNKTVTEFSLHGKLTNANSIITVGYLTQTTTITVPVTIDASLAYYLTSGSSLSGLDSINTNIMLGDTNKSVTIIGDVTDDEVLTRVRTVILASDRNAFTKDASYQVFFNTIDNNGSYTKRYSLIGFRSIAHGAQSFSNAPHRIKFALIHYADTTTCTLFLKVDETVILNWIQVDGMYVASNQTLYIGARPDGGYNWKGRIDLLNVYTRELSMAEAKSLLGEGV